VKTPQELDSAVKNAFGNLNKTFIIHVAINPSGVRKA
jgi:hypothetical protein